MKLILVLAAMLIPLLPQAMERHLDAQLPHPGSLDSILTTAGREGVTSLTITGSMNSDDAQAIASIANLRSLTLPAMTIALSPSQLQLDSLCHITYAGPVDLVGAHSFTNCPSLETVTFGSLVGHIDGYMFFNCPKLRSVTFAGPLIDTGGELFMSGCPEVETVNVEGLWLSNGLGQNNNCPKFKGYNVTGKVIESSHPAWIAPAGDNLTDADIDMIRPHLDQIIDWMSLYCDPAKHTDFKWLTANVIRYTQNQRLLDLIDRAGLTDKTKVWEENSPYLQTLAHDLEQTKLDILKQSKPLQKGENVDFVYAPATDSILMSTRLRYNLDSVAGNGSQTERIKNLLHFVHELVRHDGSSAWPDTLLNLPAIHEVCVRDKRGVNCRIMAMMLTEALLAEGIPARYITCLPKLYDLDNDCHVITVAWDSDLDKWIWVDPTFDTWVEDSEGNLLHPGEVREALIAGRELRINPDANWNHESKQTVDNYLGYYMAKNLYILHSNTLNQSEPEGRRRSSGSKRGSYVVVLPEGTDYQGTAVTNEASFWARPVMK